MAKTLKQGQKILIDGKEHYICDPEHSEKYVWITNEKSERYNKNASGWSYLKELIN